MLIVTHENDGDLLDEFCAASDVQDGSLFIRCDGYLILSYLKYLN